MSLLQFSFVALLALTGISLGQQLRHEPIFHFQSLFQMKKSLIITFITLLVFVVCNYYEGPILRSLPFLYSSKAQFYTWMLLIFEISIPILTMGLLHGFSKALPEAGWYASLPKGLALAFVCTLPMLIGYAVMFDRQPLHWNSLLIGSLLTGLGEETLFRGFLFGQLFRHGRWGFLTAVLFQGILFGLGHLWQGHSFGETVGVFAITFMGGLWFAWLMVEWRWNIWVPAFLHALMNAYWEIFAVDNSAAGGTWANVFRFSTVGISVIITLLYARRKGGLRVTKAELWWRKAA
jgi:uncharacterized protein